MMLRRNSFAFVVSVAAVVGLTGCGNPAMESVGAAPEAYDEHEHGHAAEGPHGGHIVELGEEEYHAEVTHDDTTHSVGVYLLDGAAKDAASSETMSVTINCIVNGQPMQFTLPAAPQPGDPAGQSSHFELVSEALCDASDAPNSSARLNVTIGGKPYVGEIEAHEHEQDHAHE